VSDLSKLPASSPLDLHHFKPSDVPSLVDEYVWSCLQEDRNFGEIIHGKGKGTLRDLVHTSLSKNSSVLSFTLGGSGNLENWGKTTFRLK